MEFGDVEENSSKKCEVLEASESIKIYWTQTVRINKKLNVRLVGQFDGFTDLSDVIRLH